MKRSAWSVKRFLEKKQHSFNFCDFVQQQQISAMLSELDLENSSQPTPLQTYSLSCWFFNILDFILLRLFKLVSGFSKWLFSSSFRLSVVRLTRSNAAPPARLRSMVALPWPAIVAAANWVQASPGSQTGRSSNTTTQGNKPISFTVKLQYLFKR